MSKFATCAGLKGFLRTLRAPRDSKSSSCWQSESFEMSALRLSPGRDTTDLKAQKWVWFSLNVQVVYGVQWFQGLVSLRSSLSSPDA